MRIRSFGPWIRLFAAAVIVLTLLSPALALAQSTAPGWSQAEAITTECCALYVVPVTDGSGGLHLFWVDKNGSIMYAQWMGDKWSPPIDVLSSGNRAIQDIDATYDDSGFLHVVWIAGAAGQLLYSKAHVSDAGNARAWLPPVVVAERALGAAVGVDATGRTHILYSPFETGQGIAHTSSLDGATWAEPTSIPSGLVGEWAGQRVRLAIGADDTLHATWNSVAMPGAYPEHAVYYQRSTDGGQTWSDAFDLDPLPAEVAADAESNYKNKFANVEVGPDGAVHVTWHQHTGLRWHRMSTDGGQTWGPSELAFPDLGPAFNGIVDMAFDSGGNMHTVAARNAIWYRMWQPRGGWLPAQIIDGRTPDWHYQRAAVLNGNQLFLFYPDINGSGILWYTRRTLDTPAIAPGPLPARPVSSGDAATPGQGAVSETAAGAGAEASAAQPPAGQLSTARSNSLPANLTIVFGIVPSLVFVLAVVIVQSVSMRRRG